MDEINESHNPLKQFDVFPLLPIRVSSLDLSFTNASLWMALAVAAVILFLLPASRKRALVPGRLQGAAEMLVEFVGNTLHEVTGKDGLTYFPVIFSLFMFVLTCNLFGMLPGSFTVTSHIIVTFAMAILVFLGVTIIMIAKHGFGGFLHFFLPEGTPLWMAPLLYLIELFSYLARPVSLSVRLAANMTAGHVSLKVIAGLIITFGLYAGWTMFPLLLFITAFEFAMAMIQAYIFTILTCVYLNDALHMH